MKKIFTLMMAALAAMTISAQQLYLCGDAPVGNGWGPTAANQVPMTLASDGYTNTASFDVTGQPWFCVSKGGGSSWDDFNANYRYSCSSFNGTQSGTYQFEMLGDNAVSLTAGHYDISIDARSMVMTLTYTPAAAPTTDTYSVVGDVALGVAWEPSSTDLVMTKKSETLYELEAPEALRNAIDLDGGGDGYYYGLIDSEDPYQDTISTLRALEGLSQAEWINLPVGEYGDDYDYYVMAYLVGPCMLYELQHEMGDEVFFEMMRDYYQTYGSRISTGACFVAKVLEYDGSEAVEDILLRYLDPAHL